MFTKEMHFEKVVLTENLKCFWVNFCAHKSWFTYKGENTSSTHQGFGASVRSVCCTYKIILSDYQKRSLL